MGLDIDQEKVDLINEGKSYIGHVTAEAIWEERQAKRLSASTDFSRLVESEAIIICVPTPLTEHREPDLS